MLFLDSKTRSYHGAVGSERSAEQLGLSGKAGGQHNYLHRKRKPSIRPKELKKCCLSVFAEAQTSGIQIELREKKLAFDKWFINGIRTASFVFAADLWNAAFLSLYNLVMRVMSRNRSAASKQKAHAILLSH